jgi:hypothetical protein
MSARRSFAPELLGALRAMPIEEALDRLGLHWKRDPDFRPQKDLRTTRLHVAVGSGVVELVVTGARWYDTRARKGGGGAIDLAMHLLYLPFVDAVKRLVGGCAPPSPRCLQKKGVPLDVTE